MGVVTSEVPGTQGQRWQGQVGPLLFLCLFAAQVSAFVVAPVLPAMAADLSVPVAQLGELRAVVGLLAGCTAVALAVLPGFTGLRTLLALGLAAIAGGSLLAALAPGFAALVLAHLLLGIGLGVVLTAGMAATAQWSAPEDRSRVLSRALMGPPVAAVLAPIGAGMLAGLDWRLAWLAFPFATSVAGGVWVLRMPRRWSETGTRVRVGPLWRRREIRGWLLGEWLAYAGWSAVPVFSGALLVQSYRVSAAVAGVAIAVSAAAFVAGNMITGRRPDEAPRRRLARLALVLSVTSALFGAWRPNVVLTVVLLTLLGFAAGGRALLGSGYGLEAAGAQRVPAMALRATAQQFGYLLGTASGGLVLSVAGYPGLGVQMAVLFAAAAMPHVRVQIRRRLRARFRP